MVCGALGFAFLVTLQIFMLSQLVCGGVPGLNELFVLATQLQRTHALKNHYKDILMCEII